MPQSLTRQRLCQGQCCLSRLGQQQLAYPQHAHATCSSSGTGDQRSLRIRIACAVTLTVVSTACLGIIANCASRCIAASTGRCSCHIATAARWLNRRHAVAACGCGAEQARQGVPIKAAY